MPWCPKCKAEYREGFYICNDCNVNLVDELPKKSEIIENIINDSLIILATFDNYLNAEILISILEANGIQYFKQEMNVYNYPASMQLQINIYKKDYERTLEILKLHNYEISPIKSVKIDIKQILNKLKYIIPLIIILSIALYTTLKESNKNIDLNLKEKYYENAIKKIATNEIGNQKHYDLISNYLNLYSEYYTVIGNLYFLKNQAKYLETEKKTDTEVYGLVLGAYAIAVYQNTNDTFSNKCKEYKNLKKAIMILKKHNNEKWMEYSDYLTDCK